MVQLARLLARIHQQPSWTTQSGDSEGRQIHQEMIVIVVHVPYGTNHAMKLSQMPRREFIIRPQHRH